MKKISDASLKRYPIYLKALRRIKNEGIKEIMSHELSKYVNIKSTTIRRDFSLIGSFGTQGKGYDVSKLISIISNQLGENYNEKIILVGCGNFGKAILKYNCSHDVVGSIVCAFDKDPSSITDIKIPVYNINELKEKLPEDCKIAILAISEDIQKTVEELFNVGIKGIVDMTRRHFDVPKGMIVKEIDIVSLIQEIVFEINMSSKENEE